jgi:hypothetical protein
MANVDRTTKAGNDTAIVGALRSGVLGLDQLPLAGKLYTQSEAADLVQGRIDARAALLRAKADWEAAIATYEAVDKHVDVAVRDLRNVVIAATGETSDEMATFQFVARKKRVFTPERMKEIVAKRNATRAARGTKGRKQKLAIKGVVPAKAAAPAPTPTTESPTTAPTAPTPAGTSEGSASQVDPATSGEPGKKSG